MFFKSTTNLGTAVMAGLLCVLTAACAEAQVQFRAVGREIIESRLKNSSTDNEQREQILKRLFLECGCSPERLLEQLVRKKLPPNLICSYPGQTERVIVVGAHSDHVEAGDGIVDNWSGATLLPSLLYSVSGSPRSHSFVFIAFTGEESGMLGSEFYTRQLTKEERAKIDAMINLDTLGLGPSEVWFSHSDKPLLNALARIANAMKLPISGVNVERVGSTDSESFAKYKIPRITVHSLTQDTLQILHSPKDKLDVVKWDDYYATYRLLAGYLAYLDGHLSPAETSAQKTGN